jgi:hypothetical protein
MTFNETQLTEIKEMAVRLVKARHLDNLPWEDAWNGTYPLRPSESEIAAEIAQLIEIASGARGYTTEEYLRVLHLESAESFSMFALS